MSDYEEPYVSGGGDGPAVVVDHPLPWRVVRDDMDPYDYLIVDAKDEEVCCVAGNRGFDNRFLRLAEFIVDRVNQQ